MPANPVYTDGPADYGTAVLTITPKDQPTQQWQAVADQSFVVTYPSRRVERFGQYGEYAGAFAIPQCPTGRCTIYLPSGKRARPGDKFTTDVTGSAQFVINETEDPYESDDYRKQTIVFYQILNTGGGGS